MQDRTADRLLYALKARGPQLGFSSGEAAEDHAGRRAAAARAAHIGQSCAARGSPRGRRPAKAALAADRGRSRALSRQSCRPDGGAGRILLR